MKTKDNIYELIGINPNYSKVVELYNPDTDELPEWLKDILKPEVIGQDEIKYKIIKSEKITEYYLDTGGIIRLPKGGIMTWSGKSIEVMPLDAFNILYSKVNKTPWYKKVINYFKR